LTRPRRAAAPIAFAVVLLLLSACTGSPSTASSSSRSPAATPEPSPSQHAVLRVTVAGFTLPAAVEREVAVADGSRILVAGGLDANGDSTDGVFALDPATGKVSALGTLPEPFHDAAAAWLRGRLFVFGGGASAISDAVQAFDPATGRGAVVGHLPLALADLSGAEVNGTAYVVGGYDGRVPRAEVDATTDGTHFRRVATLPVGVRYAAVTAAGSKLVVAGGISANGPVDTVRMFDPATGALSLVGHLPHPVGHAVAFDLGGDVYVAGGANAADHEQMWVARVDIASRTVVAAANLPRRVADAAAALADGREWIIGGRRGSPVADVLVAAAVLVAGP
jgi:hypothetical protein